MGDDAADREWMKGYETARVLCLTQGSQLATDRRPTTGHPAFEAGYDWGVWDYEDANGLPHRREHGA